MKNECGSIKKTLRMESDAILNAYENLDMQAAENIIEKIGSCKGNIILSGSGTSGIAAKKIAHTFNCMGRPAVFLDPFEGLHGGLGLVRSADIIILLSNGGETEEINQLIPVCKSKGAMLIAVTGNMSATLAKQADTVLKVNAGREADPFDLFATSSIIAILAVFDAISICVMEKTNYTKEDFAAVHPGGAVGKSLKNTVLEKKE